MHNKKFKSFETQAYKPTIFENRELAIAISKNGNTDAVTGVIKGASSNTEVEEAAMHVTLTLWDTAGQEDYARLRPLSYPDTDVAVICYAANLRSSFTNVIDHWHAEVRHYCGEIPIILVACKSDLAPQEQIPNAEEYVSRSEGEALALKLGVEFFETSALSGSGIKDLFDEVARSAVGISINPEDSGISLVGNKTFSANISEKRKKKICLIM